LDAEAVDQRCASCLLIVRKKFGKAAGWVRRLSLKGEQPKLRRGVSFSIRYIPVMFRGGKIVVCVLAGFVLNTNTRAVAPDSPGAPYRGIVERNVFGLKAPPAPAVDTPPPPPPVKLTLTGITTILGNKRALLSAQIPNKPVESYILSEGQRDREVEVVEIDEKAGVVKVNNHGIPQTLDFKNDGAKLQVTAMPGLPPPGGIPPPPISLNAPPSPSLRTIPTRTMRIPPPPGAANVPGPTETGGAEQPPSPTPP
jgi:hypothetical protein